MTSSNAFSRRAFLGGATAAAALGALSLAGCATTTPATQSSGSGGPKATKLHTINFYNNTLNENGQAQAWETMISDFESASGSNIKPVTYPYTNMPTQLVLAAKAKTLAGVGESLGWQGLIPFDILADLSDMTKGLGIPKGILDSYTVDGKLLALPQYAGGIGMVTNGSIAKSVGLKSGLTIDQFATALEKIKKQDSSVIPYAAVTTSPDLKDIVPWMWGFGSEVITDKMECTMGDSESVAAVKWYLSLQDQGLTSKSVNRTDARVLFARGQAAMYDDAPLASTFVTANGGTDDLAAGLGAITRPTDGKKPSFNRSWGAGLFATAGAGELTSRDFIKSMVTDVPSATILFEQSALAPASKVISEKIPAIRTNKFQTAFRDAVTEYARATPYDKIPTGAAVDTAISTGMANIMAGQVGVQDGLNQLKTTVQSLLDASKS